MSKYKLIAFDLDGTLLDSRKEVSTSSAAAIEKAVKEGKIVVFSTGRTAAELSDVRRVLPQIRYAVCNSGASIYDLHKEKSLARFPIRESIKEKILEVSMYEDVMLYGGQFGRTYVQTEDVMHMERWQLKVYQPMFEKYTDQVTDIRAFMRRNTDGFEKINLFHTDPQARARNLKRFEGLDAECVKAEETSIEITGKGVTKGNGLRSLCCELGIHIEESIAVGDSFNDIAMLEAAGLSVGMGNAQKEILDLCDVTVSDNDHGGCAEAIERYLL